jgi:hypothetical protein
VIPRRAPVLLLGAALLATGGCESFDDAVVSEGYVDFAGAARTCARVFACPGLDVALRRSIAAPIDGQNFSTCLSWLAGPSPTPPGGFAAQAAVLAQVAAATSCEAAASGLGVVPLAASDPLCAGGATTGCTSTGDVFDCAAGVTVRCDGAQFAEGSACQEDPVLGPRCAVPEPPGCKPSFAGIGTCSGSLLCADNLPPQEEIDCSAFGEGCISDMVTVPGLLHHELTAPVSLCAAVEDTDPTICKGVAEGAATCTPSGAMVVCDHVRTSTLPDGALPVLYAAVEVLYDCQADLGWGCTAPAPGSGAIPFCSPPGAACAPTDAGVNTCDGDVLAACVAGQAQPIDCGAVGASCHPGGAAGAFCAFDP